MERKGLLKERTRAQKKMVRSRGKAPLEDRKIEGRRRKASMNPDISWEQPYSPNERHNNSADRQNMKIATNNCISSPETFEQMTFGRTDISP